MVSSLLSPKYLDYLPQRPPPEPGESFTGYLTRLGDANGQEYAPGFLHLLGLDDETLRRPSECPPARSAWKRLRQVAGIEEAQLLATTLRGFGARFGRSTRSGSTMRFLGDTFVEYVRHCPLCLAEQAKPYYLLRWRFLTLPGCSRHGRRLLDECGHCGESIPPLTTPLLVATCPRCLGKLQTCPTMPLGDESLAEASLHEAELAYLLAPLKVPVPAPGRLGGWLGQQRRTRGLTRSELAGWLGIPEASLGVLERGENDKARLYFSSYLAYTRFLGISMIDLFEGVAAWDGYKDRAGDEDGEGEGEGKGAGEGEGEECASRHLRSSQGAFLEREALLVDAVLAAVERLKGEGTAVSQVNISRIVGLERSNLRRYPRVRSILGELERARARGEAERAQVYEKGLVVRVQTGIKALRARGQRLSLTAISREVDVSLSSLNYYPRVRTVMREACKEVGGRGSTSGERETAQTGETPVPKGTSEGELLIQVEAAIRSLTARGKPVTQLAIARWVNISTGWLRRYPAVRERLDEVTAQRKVALSALREAREGTLLARVFAGIEALRAEGLSANQLTLSNRLGVSPPTLVYYPRVRAVVEQLEQVRRDAIHSRQSSREEQLLGGVQEACGALEEQKQIITQESIGEWLGLTVACLTKYPRVKAFLQGVKSHTRKEIGKRRQWRRKAVVSRALRAVRTLERHGESVTYRALEPLVQRTTASLRRYPEVRAAVEGSANNPRVRRAVATKAS